VDASGTAREFKDASGWTNWVGQEAIFLLSRDANE
jgi:hypothetical protein